MIINIENLTSEMTLAKDVYTGSGNLLVSEGTKVSSALILKLLEFNIKQVKILDVEPVDVDFKEFEKGYSKSLSQIKNSFKLARYEKTVDLNDFENIVDNLIDNTKSGRGVLSYVKLIEAKDDYTLKHSINVSIASMLLGKWLGYSESAVKDLGISGLLHDIGKIFIPDYIMNKPSRLSEVEFKVMKNHPMLGYKLLKDSNMKNDKILNGVLSHHERFNGEGYPFKLNGYKISEYARIIAICDVFDAVTSDRVYKTKENPLIGLKVIFDDSYNGLDPYICKVFLNNVTNAYCGSNAVLNNGSVGKIIKIIPEQPTKPWIAIEENMYDLQVSKHLEVIDIL